MNTRSNTIPKGSPRTKISRTEIVSRSLMGRHFCELHLAGLKTAAEALAELRDCTFDLDRDRELLQALASVFAAAKFIERFKA